MAEIRREDRERIEYVSAMLVELLRMSDAKRFPVLSYFIEMACLEARHIQDNDKASDDRGKKRDAVA
ncbi:MAG: hypothetical protein CL534_27105 [Ahrensia sp.]|nr:hypothetical protein [Ahrensia sp.]